MSPTAGKKHPHLRKNIPLISEAKLGGFFKVWCALFYFLLVSDLLSELVQFAFSAALLCTPMPHSLSAGPGQPQSAPGLK